MPTKAKTSEMPTKLTAAQAREQVGKLQEKLDKFEKTSYCLMCKTHKDVYKRQLLSSYYLFRYANGVYGC